MLHLICLPLLAVCIVIGLIIDIVTLITRYTWLFTLFGFA